jgi:hypothetical protein
LFGEVFEQEDFFQPDKHLYITGKYLLRFMDSALLSGSKEFREDLHNRLNLLLAQLNHNKICLAIRPEMLFLLIVLVSTFIKFYDGSLGERNKNRYKHRSTIIMLPAR